MPKPSGKVPSYCLHKRSKQAVVRINGKDQYLGPYGSAESHERYQRVIAEWRAGFSQPEHFPGNRQSAGDLSINQLLLHWDRFAQSWYVKNGKTTHEYKEYRYALTYVRALYGSTPVREFGPLALKSVQHSMVNDDLCRNVVNHRVNRIKHVMKWAVSEELIPASVYEGLRTVAGLRFGRTEARETEPIKPVARSHVDATVPHVSPQIAAMIQLQLLTGMRPCEVVLMRACDIDVTDEVWIYTPHEHKNRWRGQTRTVPLGPKAQKIIQPYLRLETEAYIFSPVESERLRNATRRAGRKSPMTPSQAKRRPKAKPKRAKRDRFDVDSYRRAIQYGVKKANKKRKADDQIPAWFPLQLRHTRATEIRRDHGIEAAQVVLGHARADVTQVYAERNLEAAINVARKSG